MVTAFLDFVHGHGIAAGDPGRVVIAAKVNGRHLSRTFTLDDLDAAGKAVAEDSDAGHNTFCRVHLIDRDIPSYERGKSEYTSLVTHLAADVDIAGPGHKPPEGKDLPPTVDVALELIDATVPPSAIISSGGGLYPIMRLAEPFPIVDAASFARVRNVGRRLDRALASHGWHVDATALDLARLIRPPGAVNHKPGRQPLPVTVLHGYVDNTVDDVLADDPRRTWERVRDQGGWPAWRRSGSDSDYSIKQNPATGVIIVWSSTVASVLDVEPGEETEESKNPVLGGCLDSSAPGPERLFATPSDERCPVCGEVDYRPRGAGCESPGCQGF